MTRSESEAESSGRPRREGRFEASIRRYYSHLTLENRRIEKQLADLVYRYRENENLIRFLEDLKKGEGR